TQVLLAGLDLAVRGDRQDGDTRSQRQRRGDVLVQWARQEIAERGGDSVREDLRSVRAQLLLTVTAEQLAAAARIGRLGGHHTPAPLDSPGLADEVIGPWPWGGQDATAAEQPLDSTRVPAGGSLGPGLLVSLEAVRRLACDASISLAVQPDADPADSRSGLASGPLGLRPQPRRDPLYVGRAARIVTAAQWRALVLRDRRCVVQGCRRRPLQCEAHHVKHWLDGGPSDLDNLVLLCFQHHHDHHDRDHDLRHRDGRWITTTGWGAHAPP
ncbi:MAG TPA: HNH endonuclease signature motif containing protein, partial [Mycobacteriales bacterium]|nr:HNH endonuclease signature motif containing protein [Mycobacteriales bacterium]